MRARRRDRAGAAVPEPADPMRRTILIYAEAAALCLLSTFLVLDLRHADLRVPFHYTVGQDAHFFLGASKSIADTGWYLTSPRLGAPGTMALYDFPFVETGTMLGIKLIMILVRDPFIAFNLFYLATYLLACWTMLFALRRLGVHDQVAVAAGLLFAFTPYHLWRGVAHLHLSAYYPIPLLMLVALWLASARPVFTRGDSARPGWNTGATIPALAALVLGSMAGPYCVVFGAYMLGLAGLIGLLRRPGWARVVEPAVCIGLLGGLFVVQSLPFSIGVRKLGGPVQAYTRLSREYHFYSLRLVEMLRPAVGHRIGLMANASELHGPATPQDALGLLRGFGEGRLCSPLGVLGSVGLAVAAVAGLAGPSILGRKGPEPEDLGKFAVGFLLLGLDGGIGEIVADFITPKIRCYNRVSIFIECMAFATLALLASRAMAGGPTPRRRPWLLPAVWIVAILALVDQTPSAAVPDYPRDRAAFENDRRFVEQVEASLPTGAMVFQLPVVPFPEAGRTQQMEDYTQFRPYFHSKTARWSYGAMRGRPVATLQQELAQVKPADLPARLAELGFAGVYVNRRGYEDGGSGLMGLLAAASAGPPIRSRDDDLYFFLLRPRTGG